MRSVLLLWVFQLAVSCRAEPSGRPSPSDEEHQHEEGESDSDGADIDSADDDDGGDADGDGGDADQPGIAEFGRCLLADDCEAGLVCAELSDVSSYCLFECMSDPCPDGRTCAGDYCVNTVDSYDVCDALSACQSDALCFANATTSTRCAPVCEAGDLAGFDVVAACPPLPPGITGTTPSCTAGLLAGSSAKFCASTVAALERCDELALLCAAPARPDTDAAHEGADASAPDPGALRCLDDGAEYRCLRVCSDDGGSTESPCACPNDDPACDDPSDAGVAWACVGLASLASNLRVCLPVEACSSDTECEDNFVSGLTSCAASPYLSGPTDVCTAPL